MKAYIPPEDKHNRYYIVRMFCIYLSTSFTETLSPEVVKYLWDNICHLLPDALFDTGEMQSRNPIHFLSHSILKNKYVHLIIY